MRQSNQKERIQTNRLHDNFSDIQGGIRGVQLAEELDHCAPGPDGEPDGNGDISGIDDELEGADLAAVLDHGCCVENKRERD